MWLSFPLLLNVNWMWSYALSWSHPDLRDRGFKFFYVSLYVWVCVWGGSSHRNTSFRDVSNLFQMFSCWFHLHQASFNPYFLRFGKIVIIQQCISLFICYAPNTLFSPHTVPENLVLFSNFEHVVVRTGLPGLNIKSISVEENFSPEEGSSVV